MNSDKLQKFQENFEKGLFEFKDFNYKILDSKSTLYIRVKGVTFYLAKYVLEEIKGIKQPSPNHIIGYLDFDYKNLKPENLIWENRSQSFERRKIRNPNLEEKIRQVGKSNIGKKRVVKGKISELCKLQIIEMINKGYSNAEIYKTLNLEGFIKESSISNLRFKIRHERSSK